MAEGDYWWDLYEKDIISWDEVCEKDPCGYECWSCGFCGKWTGNMYYEGPNGSSIVKDPPSHIS